MNPGLSQPAVRPHPPTKNSQGKQKKSPCDFKIPEKFLLLQRDITLSDKPERLMDTMQTIPVFFTFNSNYLLAANVTLHSMLRHASRSYRYDLYVFHSTLNAGHRHTLEKCLEEFDHATLHFIDVTQYDESIKGFKAKAHYSKEIFYKLLAANLLPQYDRIICSDVDVVFTGDFSPVYFMFPEGDFYYAGVGPVENNRMPYYEPHFSPRERSILEHEISAGFMLINLKKIREDQKSEETLDFYVKNYQRFLFPEQDCIILTCWPHIKYLPLKYSLPISFYHLDMSHREFYQGNTEFAGDRTQALALFNEALEHPIQIHYAGFNKPWNSFGITRQKDWMEALMDVPAKEGILLYLATLPYNLLRRLKRYSLKRFLRKLSKKIKKR